MKLIRKITAALICASILMPTGAAFAYELPHAYWSLNDSYNAAVNAGDNSAIIQSGSQIIDLIGGEPVNDQTQNIMGSRLYTVAFACFYTGDYASAAKYFSMYLPYAKQLGWTDGEIIAENFVKQLTSRLEVYEETDELQWTYGVKNEPRGVLYGQTSEEREASDSMVLLYMEYGSGDFSWANLILNEAASQGKSVELALNFRNEGTTARNITGSDSFLSDLHTFLSQHTNVPVFVRIGAEFNIWGDKCSPDEFINAYRIVVSNLRDLSNVSMVWSAAHTSSWKNDAWPYTADDYYPGDEYVDWVGVNCYPNKYFQGRRWQGESQFNEICFKTGYSADPVLMIEDIVKTYGDRKPIMISECGSAYQTNGEINETHGDWAAYYLKQIYSFIPMVYPQVKMIAYFNKNISWETCYYDLNGSSALEGAYNNAVKSAWFVQGKNTDSAETFFKHSDGTIYADADKTIYTYPHLYGSDSVSVEYYLDGDWITTTNEIPYKANLKAVNGTHTLNVVARGSNGAVMNREYTVIGAGGNDSADTTGFKDTGSLNAVQKEAIVYAAENNILSGYEDNTVRPEGLITRAEFATLICRMMNYDVSGDSTFDDVKNHWASKYIDACVRQNVIHGMGDNKFKPDDNVTLEQAATILTLMSGMADEQTSYPDGYMSAARNNGLLENLTSDTVGLPLKRIDAAMMLYNLNK